jgi:Dehydrogenases (flavoproteins)
MRGTEVHSEPVVVAQEVEFRMTPEQRAECAVTPEIPEIYFCNDLKGYGWVFRKGNYLNIGLGREDKNSLSEQVKVFCEFLRTSKKISFDFPDDFHGHAYLLYPSGRQLITADGMLLAGDAAGMAYSHSGEGIRPAIESGILAAGIIKRARGDYSRNSLKSYQTLITARFGKRKPALTMINLLPDKIRLYLAHNLLACRWFAREIIINRWFLHTREQPVLTT